MGLVMRAHNDGVTVITKEHIAYELSDLLELPKICRTGTAYKIVTRVLQTIAAGLHRGEDVKIAGFGIFRVRKVAPRERYTAYFYGRPNPSYGIVERVPGRKYVHFKPSKHFERLLNER